MPRLRLATYNISGAINERKRFYSRRKQPHNQQRWQRARHMLDELAVLVRDQKIDIIALQEVDVCYAAWSPDESDPRVVADYLKSLTTTKGQ